MSGLEQNNQEMAEKEEVEEIAVEEQPTTEQPEESKQIEKEDTEETEATDETEREQLSEEQVKIQQLEQEVTELNNKLLRVHADYENFRRRTKEEKEAAAKYRAQSLVEELLPSLDNFERALMVEAQHEETKSLLQGMEMIYRQIQDALKKEGVEVIEAVGKPFDPYFHHAVMQTTSDEYENNYVVEELQKGYKLKDKVVRPSMVKVNAK